MSSSRPTRLRLATRRDVERRLHEIFWLLRQKYTGIVVEGEKLLDPWTLYSTQKYLEADKLGLVLRETLLNNYDPPIIVVRGREGKKYVIDGHHRARIALWLRENIRAYVLNIPLYRPVVEIPIHQLEFIHPVHSIKDPVVELWKHMVDVIRFIEKTHNMIATMRPGTIKIDELIITQPRIYVHKVDACRNEPILVYEYMEKYYIVDGHTRACIHYRLGNKTIRSVVFTLGKRIGLIRTAEKYGNSKIDEETCMDYRKDSPDSQPIVD